MFRDNSGAEKDLRHPFVLNIRMVSMEGLDSAGNATVETRQNGRTFQRVADAQEVTSCLTMLFRILQMMPSMICKAGLPS